MHLLHEMSVAMSVANMKPLLYRYDEVAQILNVSRRTVTWYITAGYLDAIGTGTGRRVSARSLNDWMMLRAPIPKDAKPAGYIYLMKFKHYYKIGLAINLSKRLRAISIEMPEPVTLVHTVPTNDMRRAESVLHRIFAKRRTNGEWFRLTPKELALFCECRSLFFE